MNQITMMVAFAAGAALAGVLTYVSMRLRVSAMLIELGGRQAHGEQVARERDGATERAEQLEQALLSKAERLGTLEHEVLRVQGPLKEQIASLESSLAGERAAHEEKVAALTSLGDQWLARIAQSAGDAVDGRGRQLVELLRREFGSAKTEAGADLARRQQAIQDLVGPLATSVAQVGERVDHLDRARREASAQLSEQLNGLRASEAETRAETGALARALSAPNVQGRWGEMHLQRAIELAGMKEHTDFVKQVHLERDGEVLRPDVVVKLPQGRHLPIDAKAPLRGYIEASQASDKETRATELSRFARNLRAHVKALGGKAYWSRLDSSPECVLMFLPGDHFLAAAAQADPAIVEDAARQQVHLVTPTTLMVALRTAATAWQQERVAEDGRAVAELGQQLHDRLVRYLGLTEKLGTALQRTVNAYNEVIGSGEQRLLPTARRLAEKGSIDATNELPKPKSIDIRPRGCGNGFSTKDVVGEDAA